MIKYTVFEEIRRSYLKVSKSPTTYNSLFKCDMLVFPDANKTQRTYIESRTKCHRTKWIPIIQNLHENNVALISQLKQMKDLTDDKPSAKMPRFLYFAYSATLLRRLSSRRVLLTIYDLRPS